MRSVILSGLIFFSVITNVFGRDFNEEVVMDDCLNYGLKVFKGNPEALLILKKMRTMENDVLVSREEINIGKQKINTKVVVKLKSGDNADFITCLYNGIEPLYFDWVHPW